MAFPKFQLRKNLYLIGQNMSGSDLNSLKFLCTFDIPKRHLERMKTTFELFCALESQGKITYEDDKYLRELLKSRHKEHYLQKYPIALPDDDISLLATDHGGAMASNDELRSLTSFLAEISDSLSHQDFMTLACFLFDPEVSSYSFQEIENMDSANNIFERLIKAKIIGPTNLTALYQVLEVIGRNDLCQKIALYLPDSEVASLYDQKVRGITPLTGHPQSISMSESNMSSTSELVSPTHPSIIQRVPMPHAPPPANYMSSSSSDNEGSHRISVDHPRDHNQVQPSAPPMTNAYPSQEHTSPSSSGTSQPQHQPNPQLPIQYHVGQNIGIPNQSMSFPSAPPMPTTTMQPSIAISHGQPGSTLNQQELPNQQGPIMLPNQQGPMMHHNQQGPIMLPNQQVPMMLPNQQGPTILPGQPEMLYPSYMSVEQPQQETYRLSPSPDHVLHMQLQKENEDLKEIAHQQSQLIEELLQKKKMEEECTFHTGSDVPVYSLKSKPHGIAIVIGNETFRQNPKRKKLILNTRTGCKSDVQNFISCFDYLQYDVKSYSNLASEKIVDLIEKTATSDHSKYDSFVFCISTHGEDNNYIFGSDGNTVDVYQLVARIQDCPSLRGKPKLFFIQACRAMPSDLVLPDGNPPIRPSINPDADLAIFWATTRSNSAYRSPRDGSWFVVTLSKIFTMDAHRMDLVSMMYKVTHVVAEMEGTDRESKEKVKQCVETNLQLRGAVHFLDKQ